MVPTSIKFKIFRNILNYVTICNIILIGVLSNLSFANEVTNSTTEINSRFTNPCASSRKYFKCLVPQLRLGNCSLEEAVQKLSSIVFNSDGTYSPIKSTTITQQISIAGYESVHHEINSNGYRLSAFRIFKENPPKGCSRPIILQHGASTNCASWTVPSSTDAIVWRLVDAGFDVWLTCARGTSFSTGHDNLKSTRTAYWDFDIDDLGRDAGNWIRYILKLTGCSKMSYAAHSMGTTAMFSLLSLYPEFNEMIDNYYAISAAAYQSHTTLIITPVANLECGYLLARNSLLPNVRRDINGPFPGRLGTRLYSTFLPYICGGSQVEAYFCAAFSFTVFGCEFSHTDYDKLKRGIPSFLDNLSIKAYRHASQNIAMKQFCQFDYGPTRNMIEYKSCRPPCYDLSLINTNVTIIAVSNDAPVGAEDVINLKAALVNANPVVVELPGARNHLDCLVGDRPEYYVDIIKKRSGLPI